MTMAVLVPRRDHAVIGDFRDGGFGVLVSGAGQSDDGGAFREDPLCWDTPIKPQKSQGYKGFFSLRQKKHLLLRIHSDPLP